MENKKPLDIYTLSSVLKVNNIDIKALRENESMNNYFKTLPNYPSLLLAIICEPNKNFSEEISLNASIQLKNYINSFWKNNKNINNNNLGDEENIIINEENKKYLRLKIFDAMLFIIEIENTSILKQLNQCLKEILKYDFRENKIEYNKEFINKVIICLSSNNLKQMYAGINLFYQLSKVFEFDNKEHQKIYNEELIRVNDYLLSTLYECKDINNSLQAKFSYKIIKIFFMSFQGNIPELFTQENIFSKWVNFIINVIKNPINKINIDTNNNKNNIFLKLKKVCYQTISRIIHKFLIIRTRNEQSSFAKIINDKYLPIFFELHKTTFQNNFNNKLLIDDYGKTCIYNFFSILMENNLLCNKIFEMFIKDKNNDLLNFIIRDSFLSYEDLKLWSIDPKKYLAEKSEEINSMLSKRYNSCKFFSSLFGYKENKNEKPKYCKTLCEFLFKNLINDNNNLNIEKQKLLIINKPYYLLYDNIYFCLKKESILYLLKNNKNLIINNSEIDLEEFFEKLIFPELNSSCSFLREQACDFIKNFRNYNYKSSIFVENLAKNLCQLMKNDPILQVRFESAMALSSILNRKEVKELLKGNILNLLQIYIKLMEETDFEEIMEIIQELIQNFTEESKDYIVQLSEYLIKYFNKLITSNKDDENKEDELDDYSLINNIINTFCNFINYFVNNGNIYPKIELYIDELLNYCLIKEPFDKLEDGIKLLEEILVKCQTVPNHIWKFFIPLVLIVIEDDKESNNYINELDNYDCEYENFMDIIKIICYYISKDNDGKLCNLIDDKGNQYLSYIIKFINKIILICEKKRQYIELKYVFDICNTLFNKYKNKVEYIADELLKYIISKLEKKENEELSNYKCFLLATCFIYYPSYSLNFIRNKNKIKEIFMFWFLQIDNIKSYKQLKYNLFGICSLISLDENQQDKLILDYIKYLVEKILKLINIINDKIQKDLKIKTDKKYGENENDNLDEEKLYKNFLEGKDISDDEDEYWEEEEDEEEEIPYTEADKQSPILIVKNTFDLINQKFPSLFNNILVCLGSDNLNKLKEIFIKEEQRLKNRCE